MIMNAWASFEPLTYEFTYMRLRQLSNWTWHISLSLFRPFEDIFKQVRSYYHGQCKIYNLNCSKHKPCNNYNFLLQVYQKSLHNSFAFVVIANRCFYLAIALVNITNRFWWVWVCNRHNSPFQHYNFLFKSCPCTKKSFIVNIRPVHLKLFAIQIFE